MGEKTVEKNKVLNKTNKSNPCILLFIISLFK